MSSQWRILRNSTTGRVILARAKWCTSFFCHFKGLQFVQRLPEDQGVLFVTQSESRANTSIHMFFMFMRIGVLWLDKSGRVVDKTLAKPWRPFYAPSEPAQYFIEANPSILEKVEIGDVLRFDEVAA
jgi:uncharacterized membrane protein (UPF0127 family)